MRPEPLIGIISDLLKGFDVNMQSAKNKKFKSPCIEVNIEWNLFSNSKLEVIAPNATRIKIQSNREPSWLAQVPDILYINGLEVCENFATRSKEKSDTINENSKIKKEKAVVKKTSFGGV